MTFSTTARQQIAVQVLVLLAAPAIVGGRNLLAQGIAPGGTNPAQQQGAAGGVAQPSPRVPEAIAAQPPASQAWPVNRPPKQAEVSWDSRGLEIKAYDSSLDQILRQVAADTGAKFEGLAQDQRVFGSYGPGRGSEVLLKLLDGSGYNVLIIGGRETDTPLEIVLSVRSPAGPQTAANNQSRSSSRQPEPERRTEYPSEALPAPNPDPFANGEPSRDPLEFMQEILQRQQKIDQQQLEQQK